MEASCWCKLIVILVFKTSFSFSNAWVHEFSCCAWWGLSAPGEGCQHLRRTVSTWVGLSAPGQGCRHLRWAVSTLDGLSAPGEGCLCLCTTMVYAVHYCGGCCALLWVYAVHYYGGCCALLWWMLCTTVVDAVHYCGCMLCTTLVRYLWLLSSGTCLFIQPKRNFSCPHQTL